MSEYPYADSEDSPPRCSKCGCFMKVTCWMNEGSSEEISVKCVNKKCKSKLTPTPITNEDNLK